jgi:hypothetical protein
LTDQGISLHQQQNGRVQTSWILLDNQSTVNLFLNKELLTNIRTMDRVMKIRCNAGVMRTSMIGDLPGYDGEVWYNPTGIANILSLSDVEKYHQVTYDSRAEKAFVVHKADGNERRFKQSKKGLFYLDTNRKSGTVLINTVAGNKISNAKRTYKQAMLARKVQNMIGRPSLSSFLKIVENNLLKNCPISREDGLAAEDILGPNLGSLKGKIVRRKGTHVRTQYHGKASGRTSLCRHHVCQPNSIFHHDLPEHQILNNRSAEESQKTQQFYMRSKMLTPSTTTAVVGVRDQTQAWRL